jgi:putative two-component system response regulator
VPIPFIFLASPKVSKTIERSPELGMEDILVKPIDPGKMLRVIHARLLRAAELEIAHIGQAYLDTVKVLANAIEGRDAYTRGHVDRVSTYARLLAEELHWPPDQIRTLEFGARLHDIGKIMIPDQILNKPGPFTNEEWALMKQHPSAGAKILRGIGHLQAIIPYVLYHHERWDGMGYPEGLKGKEIPLEARILALVDVYDALTTPRPYHPARPLDATIGFLRNEAGKHFDPDLVRIFIGIIERQQKSDQNPTRPRP